MTASIQVRESREFLRSPEMRRVILALDYPVDIRDAKAEQIIESYVAHVEWHLDGAWVDQDLVGAIGIQPGEGTSGEIRHIAVLREHRRQGVGTELVRHVFAQYGLTQLHAETDRNGIGFYQKRGFSVRSLGEYPGTERVWCTIHRDLVVG